MTTDHGTTKVYYHLDDSTPYMSVIPVSSDNITLGDFKKVFNRRGYNYFCKEYDADLQREVKVEITSDSQKLHKSANGLIELFLLSQSLSIAALGNAVQSSGTLPRAKNSSASTIDFAAPVFKLNKRRSSAHALSSIADELDVGGGQRVSMVTNERSMSGEASSDINTLVSKRAGEHMAELYTSTSEDPYKFDGTSALSFASSNYRQLLIPSYTRKVDEGGNGEESSMIHNYHRYNSTLTSQNCRQRKPRKQRYRKAYVPSTISSASESSLSFSLPRVDEVQLRLQDAPKLGISVACHDGGVFISKITPGSAADLCRQLEVGDQIVQIEHVSFENLSDEQAVDELRKASLMKRTITIYVAKRPRVSDQRSDALSLLCETMQMDVSLWVEQTTKQDIIEPVSPFKDLIHNVPIMDEDQLRLNPSLLAPNHFSATNENNGAILVNNINHGTLIPGNYNITNNSAMAVQSSNINILDSDSGAVTSDEERAAYVDRRNGVGPRLVSAFQNKKHTVTTAMAHQQMQFPQSLKQQNDAANNKGVVTQLFACSSNPGTNVADSVRITFPNCATEKSAKNELYVESLNVGTDPIVILKRMARPDSGLVIKDRKWLKIPVLNSFIGDEMIDWLLRNVTGFKDRKAAKAYASILLANGYIKHVVNMTNFNEKCYYIFEDSIINERLRLLQQQQVISHSTLTSSAATTSTSTRVSGVLPIPNGSVESTTEVTYMSSPSSPFFPSNSKNNPQLPPNKSAPLNLNPAFNPGMIVKIGANPRYVSPPTHILGNEIALRLNNNANIPNDKNNNTKINTLASNALDAANHNPNVTWPISPIPLFSNNNIRDCESPSATNDYASMIQGDINGAQMDHFDEATLRLKENNYPQIMPSLSVSNNAGISHSECLLPSSVPPPIPLQCPLAISKKLF